jgi:MerR family transcriptional regulator, light-induced transcriptional regulator
VSNADPLTIRDVERRTGVPAGTLRMWETRYGFPVPRRLASGHRRFTPDDCDAIVRVLAERGRGLSLKAAIDRVLNAPTELEQSLFATLRRARPDLMPQVLPKRALVAISHAIEDECTARADRAVLFGAFQRVHFYRAAEPRWRELARTADLAVAFADFQEPRIRENGVSELPLEGDAPLRREWSLICEGERLAVALTAWEVTAERSVPDKDRRFETIWTVEPEAVRTVATAAAALAARTDPELVETRARRLTEQPPPPAELSGVMALMNRCIAYLAASP